MVNVKHRDMNISCALCLGTEWREFCCCTAGPSLFSAVLQFCQNSAAVNINLVLIIKLVHLSLSPNNKKLANFLVNKGLFCHHEDNTNIANQRLK